jgi:hypothetical protein
MLRGIVNSSPNAPTKKLSAKKPYQKPVLRFYGDIGVVTATSMMGMISDGAAAAPRKTG